jgi:outer membrane lipoprotein SlyB
MCYEAEADHSHSSLPGKLILLGLVAVTLCACVVPERRAHRAMPPPEPVNTASIAAVYVYPANGQSDSQLDRDRYECHQWSVKQTGYDPSQVHSASERVEVVSAAPPGASTAAGAVTGAILGAAVSRPRNAGGGAIVGAVAGAMVGAAVDENRQERVDRVQERYDRRHEQAVQQAQGYRRAITACLEGRGYTVK